MKMGGKEKMFRKITAILLSITLLLTLCPFVGVFAATSYQTENFNGAAASDDYAAFSSLDLTGNVLSTDSTESVFKIVEGTGADGKTTKMLEMKSPTSANAVLELPAFNYTIGAGTEYSVSFNFYFDKLPTAATEFTNSTGLFMQMLRSGENNAGGCGYYSHNTAGVASNGKMILSSNFEKKSLSNDVTEKTWYRAELYIKDLTAGETYNSSGTATNVADNKTGGYIVRGLYDMSDKVLNGSNLTTDSRQYKKNSEFSDLFVFDLKPVLADGNGFVVRIDDVEFRSFNPSTDGPAVRKSTIAGGSSISKDTTEATIVFDQELSDTSVVKLITGTTETQPTLTKVSSTLNTATYTLSDLSLEEGKSYKLDFSGCTNAGGVASSASISFATQSGAPEIKSNSLKEGAEISPIGATATVTFDQKLSDESKVVVYEDGGAELLCTLNNTEGNTYTVTLPELKDGTNYTLDFTGCKNDSGALCTDKVNFKTTIVRIVKLTDDFETNLIGTATSGYKGYNTDKTDASPLYSTARKKNGNDNVLGSSRVAGYGNEGYALQLSTVMDGEPTSAGERMINVLETSVAHRPETNPEKSSEYEQFVLTYRLNITRKAEKSDINFYTGDTNTLYYDRVIASIRNLEDGTMVISALYGEDDGRDNVTAPIAENKWYNIVWTIDGNEQVFNLIDDETGKLIFTSTKTIAIPDDDDGDYQIIIFNGNRTSEKNHNQTVLIDDFTFWKIKPWMNEQKLTADVTGAGTIDMSFNQPVIATVDMLDAYKVVNDKNIPVNGTPEFTYNDFCKISVNYKNLRYMTEYVVDYSEVISAGGAGFGDEVTLTHSFNSGKDPAGLTLIGDISYDDALGKGAEITAKMQKNSDGTASVIAAFYKGDELLGVALSAVEEFTKDEAKDVTLTLENDMSEADTIKVFGWNSLETLVPTMSTYVEVK